ncbi:MAG TPA: hypothetical protein VI039_02300 [Solirubrobacterales bacterium]
MRGGAAIRLWLAVALALFAAPAAAHASVGNFAMAVQPDGRILVAGGAGHVGPSPNREFGAVVRYLSNGKLDRSFGGGDGVVNLPRMQPITAIALQRDRRIVIAAPAGGTAGLARLLPDGHLDGNFGFAGFASSGADYPPYPTSLGVSRSGKIFVGGMTGYLNDPGEHWYGSIHRVDAGGRSGAWIGSMTNREGAPGEPKTFVNDFVLGKGESVIGAGSLAPRELGARSQAVLARLVPGTYTGNLVTGPDPSFGGGAGLVLSNFFPPAPEVANALSRDGNGLLVAGQADGKLLLARYSGEGFLDTSFGRGGAFVTSGGRHGEATANALVVRGKRIYTAGSSTFRCGKGSCRGVLLTRHKSNGKLDRRFSGNGVVSPKVEGGGGSGSEVAYDLAVGPQGEVLVGGLLTGSNSNRFFLRRYLADGKPDGTFGREGRVTTLPAAVKPAR